MLPVLVTSIVPAVTSRAGFPTTSGTPMFTKPVAFTIWNRPRTLMRPLMVTLPADTMVRFSSASVPPMSPWITTLPVPAMIVRLSAAPAVPPTPSATPSRRPVIVTSPPNGPVLIVMSLPAPIMTLSSISLSSPFV